ncbi:MAG: two-component system response regulator, partial [Bacteroidia bacterium]
ESKILLIDDDMWNISIGTILVKRAVGLDYLHTFTEPKEGLEYLSSENAENLKDTIIVFLDVNMPAMTGWEFLDRFEQLPASVKDKTKIYMLSGSIDNRDFEKAKDNKYVVEFLEKPISIEIIQEAWGQRSFAAN